MRAEKERIWRNGSVPVVVKSNLKDLIRPLWNNINKEKSTADIKK